jgi:hypothetical protein
VPLFQFFSLTRNTDECTSGLFARHDLSSLVQRVRSLDPIPGLNSLVHGSVFVAQTSARLAYRATVAKYNSDTLHARTIPRYGMTGAGLKFQHQVHTLADQQFRVAQSLTGAVPVIHGDQMHVLFGGRGALELESAARSERGRR